MQVTFSSCCVRLALVCPTFVGFYYLCCSLYHFGQSDTERLPLNGLIKQLFILARGLV